MASRVVPQEAEALGKDDELAEQVTIKDEGKEEVCAEPEKDSSSVAIAQESGEAGEERAVIPASRKELWGWYLYDFAANAFYAVALPIFFPLLLTTLANEQVGSQLQPDLRGSRPKAVPL